MLTETPQVDEPRGQEYGCGVSGADCLVVVMKRGNARGAKGTGHSRHDRVVNWQQEELLGRCGESVSSL